MDPVNVNNNTARSSIKTSEILSKFRVAFTHLKDLVQQEFSRQQQLIQENMA